MLHRLILREHPLITILLDFKKYKWVLNLANLTILPILNQV